jgi:transposase InsO family protein
VAIDRTSKFAFVELHEKATTRVAADFLAALIKAVPYKVHTVLTDHGLHFTTPSNTASAAPLIKEALARGEPVWAHAFEYACAVNDIDHRLTKPKHPWTNGQVERMNRTLKDATVKRYHYDSHDQLRAHLQLFVDAYNHARRLKTVRGAKARAEVSGRSCRVGSVPTWSGHVGAGEDHPCRPATR